MRRRGWTGVAAVAAAALASTVVLVAHGASSGPAVADAADAAEVPADMYWLVFNGCQSSALPNIGWSVQQEDDGRVRIEFIDASGVHIDDPVLRLQEQSLNDCVNRYRFAPMEDASIWEERGAAQRLLIFDVYQRAVRPCLIARGIHTAQPSLEQYLDPQMIPWADIYWAASGAGSRRPAPDLDDLIAARAACGLPSDILANG